MEEGKTIKQYAKEALKRMKSGFWQDYRKNLGLKVEQAQSNGVLASKVKEYYAERITENIKNDNEENELFYQKVKDILDTEGEISNAIGRLTDLEVYNRLDYDAKQRYSLELSSKYIKAVERYNKEKSMQF